MYISVIVPTIGRTSLKETLESIAKQTYQNFEIIITDDTKDRKAERVVENFKAKYPQLNIKYVINTKYKNGPGGNKNNGLDHAEGDFVTFIDDDDTLLPNALEVAFRHIKNKNLDVFLANCKDKTKGVKTGLSYGISTYIPYESFLKGKYDGDYFLVVKKYLIGTDRFPENAWGAEIVLWLKVFKKTKNIFYLDDVLKICDTQNSERVTKKMICYPERQVLNYYYLIDQHHDDLLKIAPKQLFRYTFRGIYFARLSGDGKKMIWFLKKIFRTKKIFFPVLFFYSFFLWCLPKNLIIRLNEFLFLTLGSWVKKLLIEN